MPPVPSPDPSASLTPFQSYMVEWHGYVAEAAYRGLWLAVTAFGLLIVAGFIVAVGSTSKGD